MDVNPDPYVEQAQSVRSFAYIQETNHAFRPQMEDSKVIQDSFMGQNNQGLFTILDGHGGKPAVDYCTARLRAELEKSINLNSVDMA